MTRLGAEESAGTQAASFSEVFSAALRGSPCRVTGLHAVAMPLPVEEWTREVDAGDLHLVDLCEGPTLDVGCGPGRLAAALAERDQVVLGIDVVEEAIEQTRRRGAAALLCDVFDEVPREGTWRTALLADGNVGIGGDPVALLARLREVVDRRGRIVVELAPPGVDTRAVWASLETPELVSRPFRWSVVGADDIEGIAAAAGLEVRSCEGTHGRWVAVLGAPR